MRATEKLEQPLKRAVIVRSGRAGFLGDLAAGAALPTQPVESGIPPGTEFDAWKRFIGGEGLFGVLDRPERAAASVKSPDLVDELERPPVFIQRLK